MFSDPAVVSALSTQSLAILWTGTFLGGLAAGAAGFAFGIVASSIWLHVLSPVHNAFLVVSCGVLLQIGTLWPARRGIEHRKLWPFILGGAFGIPLGVGLLVVSDAGRLKLALGLFLLAYGLYALLAPRLPYVGGGGRPADALVGLVSGVLGGLGGYSGVLPAIWAQLRGWPKEVARGVYQPFIVFAHLATLVLIGFVAVDLAGVVLLIAALPALAAGGWLGWVIYGRLDDRRFRQLLAALLVASGAALVI
jgi:uncharacterized membrane protein YfcA